MNLSLSDDVDEILRRAGGSRGVTAYVEDLVRDAARAWQEALMQLVTAGWTTNEVFAACDALNGYWLVGRPSGSCLALELHDDARLNGSVAKWQLDGDRWRERIKHLGGNDTEAYALWTVVSEFWRHNEELDRAIKRIGAKLPE